MDRTYGWGVLPAIDGYFYLSYKQEKIVIIRMQVNISIHVSKYFSPTWTWELKLS